MDVNYPRYRAFKSGLLGGWKERVMSILLALESATKSGSSSLICGAAFSY